LDRDPAAEILSGRGLTGAYRFDPGVRLIWVVDLESGGPGQARATGGGARPAATRARRRYGGERRRNGGFGAGVHCLLRGLHRTGTFSGARRTPRRPPRAAKTAWDGGRWRSAAAELQRSRAGDEVHEGANKRHQRAPYLAAVLRSSSKAIERRRRHRSNTAAD
jgi:hypothetical protein